MRMVRKGSIVALVASMLVGVVAALTASAAPSKVAVCHFTGQAEVIQGAVIDGEFDPFATQVLYVGHVIEVAEPAALQLAGQGDVVVPVGIEDVVKGATCGLNQIIDGDGNLVVSVVFIEGANGGLPFPAP